MTDVVASLKYVKGSHYKINNVASLIRGLSVIEAQKQLVFCESRFALLISKLLKSAVANAVNNFKFPKQDLVVKRVDIGKSFILKRSMPRGRGRFSRIEKKFSNVRIVLCSKNG